MASRLPQKRSYGSGSMFPLGNSRVKAAKQKRSLIRPALDTLHYHASSQSDLQHTVLPSSTPSSYHPNIQSPTSDPSEAIIQIENGDDDDSLNEIVMALDVKDRGTLGCCYYLADEETLYVMQDIKSGGAEMIDICSRLSGN